MGGDTETRQMTPYFSSTFSALTVCNIHFCICLDHSGLKNTAIAGKSYRFGQSFILFQKIDTLRLLKIHIIFCPPSVAKKSISSRTMVEDLYERSDTNFEHVFSIWYLYKVFCIWFARKFYSQTWNFHFGRYHIRKKHKALRFRFWIIDLFASFHIKFYLYKFRLISLKGCREKLFLGNLALVE